MNSLNVSKSQKKHVILVNNTAAASPGKKRKEMPRQSEIEQPNRRGGAQRRPSKSPVRHAQWIGDQLKHGEEEGRKEARRGARRGAGKQGREQGREQDEQNETCGCKSQRRLLGLMRQHESVHQRLRAATKLQRVADRRHQEELNKIRREKLKGPEIALQRLELQNARLRRIIVLAQHGGGDWSALNSSFTATPTVPPPSGPPPSRTGRRNRTTSRKFHFVVDRTTSIPVVSEVGSESTNSLHSKVAGSGSFGDHVRSGPLGLSQFH